ncbi:hypothetical protein BDV12DRAFT_165927 [Aspergillus spectabilis]
MLYSYFPSGPSSVPDTYIFSLFIAIGLSLAFLGRLAFQNCGVQIRRSRFYSSKFSAFRSRLQNPLHHYMCIESTGNINLINISSHGL